MLVTDRETIAKDADFVTRMTDIRRDIHRHPETAFEEQRTSDLVADFLTELGIEVHRGLGKTGVVGTLKGRRGGNRRIGLRADMDALFIEEKTGLPYASTVSGKMHACGHDGHTTMLLGAAEKLAADPDFAGTVHFIFQPAEEGLGGAKVMIDEGLFAQFPCDAVYGLHNMPNQPVGKISTRVGPMMAASDTWEVRFHGDGGHGAMPHRGTDPTMAAASFMSALSTIVARNVSAQDWAVISIGHIAAGAADSPNIIPSEVFIRGTSRSFLPETRDLIERRLDELAHGAADMHGCTAVPNFIRRYPALINTADETARAIIAAGHSAGVTNVDGEAAPIGASEDFAYMLERVPGAYVNLGMGEAGPFVHTPLYDFNDGIIPDGVAYWINVVGEELGQDKPAP